MQNNPTQQPVIAKSRTISPIWFLPSIAALLGLWILFENITHKNEQIIIHFKRADSIIVDKTKIRYKGVIVGTVKKIELDKDDGVNVIAEIESHAVFLLTQKSQFWLVSPKASLTSISGLDTLFSGSYINLLPGEGAPENEFIATDEQPISIPDNALLLTLKSKNAASINVGTPIFYKKIQVGEVARVRIDQSGQFINIHVFIDSKYSHLVKESSRFWNISGLNANLSRAGIDFKLDSLTALIAGGITFNSPSSSTPPKAGKQYQLFDDIHASQQGLSITLKLKNTHNLPNRAGILFKGHGIGRIDKIRYDSDSQLFLAQATINPAFAEMMTEHAQFWVAKTALSFSKIENLGNIITGDYISFMHSQDYQQENSATDFLVTHHKDTHSQTHRVTLMTDNANGLTEGAVVSYKGLNIGRVSTLHLSKAQDQIEVTLDIDNEFYFLINKNSKFYLSSGIDFKASLKGLELHSKPLHHILKGGITLYNGETINTRPQSKSKQSPSDQHIFHLYSSKEQAKLGKNAFSEPLELILLSKELPSVRVGSPLYYHKLQIGEVSALSLHDSSLMQTRVKVNPQFKHLISANTVFWNISGINVEANMAGVKVNTDSLLAIAAGGIALEISPSTSNNQLSSGAYRLFDSFQQATNPPKQLTLSYADAYDLKVGNKVKLQGLVVGEVNQLKLNKNNKVIATLDIAPEYFDKIAKQGSRFWIVRSDISLTGTKHLDTLLSGVFINVAPGKGKKTIAFQGEMNEPLLAQHQTGLPITLMATNAGSTDISSPVYHRQVQIGEVIDKRLNSNASGVEIIINIYPKYAHLIRTNSVFWPASGFNLDIGISGASLKSTSLSSLLKGGISMSTPDDQKLHPASDAFSRFKLQTDIEDEWLQWKMKIPNSN